MLTRYFLLTAVASGAFLGAVPANADTLEEALIAAYENNPGIELERALTRANDEGVAQAKAAYGPNLTINASHDYTYQRNDLSGTTFSNDGFATTASANLSQPLFTSGALAAGLDLAEANRLASHEDLRANSQQLILDVIEAYVTVRRDLELFEVASDIYELLDEQSDITRSRFDLRDATAPDVDQTVNRAEIAAGRVIQARSNLEASAAAYRSLVGKYPDDLPPPPQLPPLTSIEEMYLLAEQSSPELLSALYTRQASVAQLAASRAQIGPRAQADVTAGRLPLSPFANSDTADQIVAGVSLTVPLYTGGLVSSRIREARERNIAAQYLVEQTRRTVRGALAADWNQYQAANLSLPRFRSAVEAARRAVAGVQQQETSGIRTLRDVLDVTNDLFNARSAAAQAEADRYISHAAALRDAGLLSIGLFTQVTDYDPMDYDTGGVAGLPLRPLLDPIDAAFTNGRTKDAGVVVEDDDVYEPAQQLDDPLD